MIKRQPYLRGKKLSLVVFVSAVVLGAITTFLAQDYAAKRELASLQSTANEALALQSETLDGILEKYRLLPSVLSVRPDVIAMLSSSSEIEQFELRNQAARIAREVTGFTSALDLAFVDKNDQIFGSVNDLVPPASFSNEAMRSTLRQRRLGRANISLKNGTRAYLFASAVHANNRHIGAVAVLVPFDVIEATWSLSRNPIFVTQADEKVFLSNRATWVGRFWTSSFNDNDNLAHYNHSGSNRLIGPDKTQYVEATEAMPLLRWTLHVLVNAHSVSSARITAGLIAALAIAIASLILWSIITRNEASRLQMRRDKALSLRLERRVRDRTQELRATQHELIHAAKLAVIGQMSTALSHEYNQPLGAIKTYADNARTFLSKGRSDSALDAMVRIEALVDRMVALSRSLLSFSRKPGTSLRMTPIRAIIDEAVIVTASRTAAANVMIVVECAENLMGNTGKTRLAQVFVNLINNAVDAMCDDNDRAPDGSKIEIMAHINTMENQIHINVSDNGPGMPQAVAANVFTPFFTTKRAGRGVGLGLAIVDNIMRDLTGTIEVAKSMTGGAAFVITIPAAKSVEDVDKELKQEERSVE